MSHIIKFMLIQLSFVVGLAAQAQGPPITSDKPIMLASKQLLLKTLTEIRKTDLGTFTRIPIMLHYLPSSNSLVSIHMPLVAHSFRGEDLRGNNGLNFGDLELMAKYQFVRKDQMGKTFRVVAKTIQTLPTGKKYGLEDISTGIYNGYYAVVAGYETIKYGISNELGYRWNPINSSDELRYKLGFGLPLLKPVYPVNQINLFFEYSSLWELEREQYSLLFAQGIQYAKKQLTVEVAFQLPLVQTGINAGFANRHYSLFLGTRYVF